VSYANGKPRVVAVVSYGDPDCLAKIPGVNARIAPVRDWILSRLNAQRETITPLKILPDEFNEEAN